MNKRVPYVFYGVMIAACASSAYANRNPHAVFSMGGERRPLSCIAFSQLAPLTYENRPSLQSYIAEVKRSTELEQKELALAFPQISVSGFAASTNSQPIYGVEYAKRNASIHLSQLIWSFAGPLQKYRIQRATTNVNEEAEHFHRTAIRFESESTFLDALLNVRNKNRITALDTSSHFLFERAITQHEVGFLSRPQWQQSQSDFTTAQTAVKRYQDDLKGSFSFLERALSIPFMLESRNETPELLMEHGLLDFHVASLDKYLENALLFRHDLAGLAWDVDRAEKNASFLLHTYAPTINFTLDAQRNKFTILVFGETAPLISLQFGITASWQFDSFYNAYDASATEAETISLKMQQLDLSLQIQRDVKSAYYQLQALLKEVEAEKARYITAQEVYEFQKQAFEVGQISEVELKAAETDWKNAQYALDTQAIITEKKHRELLFTCGYPPEFE